MRERKKSLNRRWRSCSDDCIKVANDVPAFLSLSQSLSLPFSQSLSLPPSLSPALVVTILIYNHNEKIMDFESFSHGRFYSVNVRAWGRVGARSNGGGGGNNDTSR